MVALAAAPLAAQGDKPAHHAPKPPKSLRLYIFDCGVLKPADAKAFGFDQVAELKMSVPCFLVAHPKGTMMWDVGVVPDSDFKARWESGQRKVSSRSPSRSSRNWRPLGYEPEDIKYLAFSHYHIDHTANANMFAGSTWLVSQAERDIMFSDKPAPVRVEKNFSALKDSKTTILPADIRLRRLRRRNGNHQADSWPHSRPPGAVSETPQNRARARSRATCIITTKSAIPITCRTSSTTRSSRSRAAPRLRNFSRHRARSCGSSTTSPPTPS